MVVIPLPRRREERRLAHRLLHRLQPPRSANKVGRHPQRNLRLRPLPRRVGDIIKQQLRNNYKKGARLHSLCTFSVKETYFLLMV